MKSVVILQARTNSSRLPGKVLLPVGGIPLVVLAAKRAANTGRKVIVATSTEVTDNALAETLLSHGVNVYRGSLENTLERIVCALSEYEDETLVFRLTADNVFPDGQLLDEIEKDFIARNLDYLCCNGESSGLPYGLSAELTRLVHFRVALVKTQSKYDQEHVTPYIRRVFGEAYFDKYKHLEMGSFRCTVDCLDDYLGIRQVFSGVEDVIQIPALELVNRLTVIPYQPMQLRQAPKLVLGTAQLGLNYGIANESGKPTQIEAEKLIKNAIVNGATYIDTAAAYGDSEEVIGNVLKSGWEGRARIVTKLLPLTDCPSDANSDIVKAFVDASIYKSCMALRMQCLDVLMLHRASHMYDWHGNVWSRLLEHKANGLLMALGVSVQSHDELEAALASTEIEFIQMPFNVFDWRWDELVPKIKSEKKSRPIKIHVRSTLLQGLLVSENVEHWRKANVMSPQIVMDWLVEQSSKSGCDSVTEFCLNFVKSLDWIDGLVIGMETMAQLSENIEILCKPDFPTDFIRSVILTRPRLENHSLNPACWRKV